MKTVEAHHLLRAPRLLRLLCLSRGRPTAPELIGDYGRTLIDLLQHVLPLYASSLRRSTPASAAAGARRSSCSASSSARPPCSFGTCSSVATIPTNHGGGRGDRHQQRRVQHRRSAGRRRCTWTAPPCPPSSRSRSCSACSGRTSRRAARSLPSSWRCSPRSPCPAFPAAAARASWSCAPSSSRSSLAVAFPIALALGNLVDPPATMVNSAGDYVVSFIVSRYRRRQGLAAEEAFPQPCNRSSKGPMIFRRAHIWARRFLCLLTLQFFVIRSFHKSYRKLYQFVCCHRFYDVFTE